MSDAAKVEHLFIVVVGVTLRCSAAPPTEWLCLVRGVMSTCNARTSSRFNIRVAVGASPPSSALSSAESNAKLIAHATSKLGLLIVSYDLIM